MPTRPDQDDPDRRRVWEQRRVVLGARIRELRVAAGLTQESLGLEAGISRNMIIGVEWGRRGILAERLGDIADVLGVTAADLLIEPEAARNLDL